jgi:hypothetical protein
MVSLGNVLRFLLYTKRTKAPSETEVIVDFKPSVLARWETK